MTEYRGSKKHPYHLSCGGVISRKSNGNKTEILLLRREKKKGWKFNSWHLPKGTKQKEENNRETAVREILEETGYQVRVGRQIGKLRSRYRLGETKIEKTTYYYLCQPIKHVHQEITEHDAIGWYPINRAIKLLAKFPIYENEGKILQKLKSQRVNNKS